MRTVIAAFAALVLSLNAHSAGVDYEETTTKALAAGEPAAVVKALERQIYRGNLVAARQLGLMYRDGKGVVRDYARARKLLKTAAEAHEIRIAYRFGIAEAQYELAVMLRDGIGGKADASAAVSWLEQAAEQGNVQAQLALARMYIDGAGTKRNSERAFVWSSIAATLSADAVQKEAERTRDLAQRQLEPGQLTRARNLIKNWKPRTS